MKKSWTLGFPSPLSHPINLLRCQRGGLDGVVTQHARLVIREKWVRVPLKAQTPIFRMSVSKGKMHCVLLSSVTCNRTTFVENVNWLEANHFPIYKCISEVEPNTTRIKFNYWSGRVLNPGSKCSNHCTALPPPEY